MKVEDFIAFLASGFLALLAFASFVAGLDLAFLSTGRGLADGARLSDVITVGDAVVCWVTAQRTWKSWKEWPKT